MQKSSTNAPGTYFAIVASCRHLLFPWYFRDRHKKEKMARKAASTSENTKSTLPTQINNSVAQAVGKKLEGGRSGQQNGDGAAAVQRIPASSTLSDRSRGLKRKLAGQDRPGDAPSKNTKHSHSNNTSTSTAPDGTNSNTNPTNTAANDGQRKVLTGILEQREMLLQRIVLAREAAQARLKHLPTTLSTKEEKEEYTARTRKAVSAPKKSSASASASSATSKAEQKRQQRASSRRASQKKYESYVTAYEEDASAASSSTTVLNGFTPTLRSFEST